MRQEVLDGRRKITIDPRSTQGPSGKDESFCEMPNQKQKPPEKEVIVVSSVVEEIPDVENSDLDRNSKNEDGHLSERQAREKQQRKSLQQEKQKKKDIADKERAKDRKEHHKKQYRSQINNQIKTGKEIYEREKNKAKLDNRIDQLGDDNAPPEKKFDAAAALRSPMVEFTVLLRVGWFDYVSEQPTLASCSSQLAKNLFNRIYHYRLPRVRELPAKVIKLVSSEFNPNYNVVTVKSANYFISHHPNMRKLYNYIHINRGELQALRFQQTCLEYIFSRYESIQYVLSETSLTYEHEGALQQQFARSWRTPESPFFNRYGALKKLLYGALALLLLGLLYRRCKNRLNTSISSLINTFKNVFVLGPRVTVLRPGLVEKPSSDVVSHPSSSVLSNTWSFLKQSFSRSVPNVSLPSSASIRDTVTTGLTKLSGTWSFLKNSFSRSVPTVSVMENLMVIQETVSRNVPTASQAWSFLKGSLDYCRQIPFGQAFSSGTTLMNNAVSDTRVLFTRVRESLPDVSRMLPARQPRLTWTQRDARFSLWVFIKNRWRSPRPDNIHTICQTFPRISIFLEEIIKSFPGGTFFVGFIEYLQTGSWSHYHWHIHSMKYNFATRLREHYRISRPASFLQTNYLHLTPDEMEFLPDSVDNISNTSMPSQPLPKVGPNYQLDQQPNIPAHDVQYPGFHAFFFNVGAFQMPANSPENQAAALHMRVLDIVDTRVKLNHFSYTDLLKCVHSLTTPLKQLEYQEWFSHLNSRQKLQVVRASEEREKGIFQTKVDVNCKTDELIYSKVKFVPRVIFNFSGHFLEEMGLVVTIITKSLSQGVFSKHGHEFVYNHTPARAYFTCGALSSDLDDFFNSAIAGSGLWLLSMGDDLAGVHDDRGRKYYFESDFSKYDRTISNKLVDIFFVMLETLGFKEYEQAFFKIWQVKLSMRSRRWEKMTGKKSQQINSSYDGLKLPGHRTGEPATCLLNSVLSIFVTIYVMNRFSNPVQGYAAFGLTAKFLRRNTPNVTFLKGMFLENEHGNYQWTRMPSFIAKLGKTMTDPCDIFKKPPVASYHDCLRSQWLGFGDMSSVFYYSQLNNLILKKTFLSTITVPPQLDFWKITSVSKAKIPFDVYRQFLASRYNSTCEDFEEFLSLLDRGTIPFVYRSKFIEHAADTDYG